MSARKTLKGKRFLGDFLLWVGIGLTPGAIYAHDPLGSQAEASAAVGPGKAITQVHPELGFQLSPNAIQTLGIHFKTISQLPSIRLPRSALIYFQDEVGVYRCRLGWFKLISIHPASLSETEFTLNPDEIRHPIRLGDQIVIEGGTFLRMTELQIGEGIEEGSRASK